MKNAIACVAVVLLAAGATVANAAAAPTPTAGKTALPPDAAERLAGGETFYNGQYVPLPLLLDDYHAVRRKSTNSLPPARRRGPAWKPLRRTWRR